MFSIDRSRSLVALAVTAGLLAVTATAGASNGVVTDNKDPDKLVFMADMGGQYFTAVARPAPDGIIAVLIGLNHADRSAGIAGDGLPVPDVVAPQTDPRASAYTPPIGTDKGS